MLLQLYSLYLTIMQECAWPGSNLVWCVGVTGFLWLLHRSQLMTSLTLHVS
jgi:hypothetical protein